MGAEDVVRALVARVWNEHRLEELHKYFASDFEHNGQSERVADLSAWHQTDAEVWSDTRYEILTLVSDGRQVALRWRTTARHVGRWGPVEPSGKEVTWEGVHFFIVDHNRVTAMWAFADRFAKAMQLGVAMTPPSS